MTDPILRFRFDTYHVHGEFCNVRVWAGESGHLTNCGILVFFHEEWLAFQMLLRGRQPGVEVEHKGIEEAHRQLSLDFRSPLAGLEAPIVIREEET